VRTQDVFRLRDAFGDVFVAEARARDGEVLREVHLHAAQPVLQVRRGRQPAHDPDVAGLAVEQLVHDVGLLLAALDVVDAVEAGAFALGRVGIPGDDLDAFGDRAIDRFDHRLTVVDRDADAVVARRDQAVDGRDLLRAVGLRRSGKAELNVPEFVRALLSGEIGDFENRIVQALGNDHDADFVQG
jgi:hypothetical protein